MHSVRHPGGTWSFTIHSKRCLMDSTEIMEGRHIRSLWKLDFTFGRSKYNLFRNGGMSTIRNKTVYIATLCSTRVVSQMTAIILECSLSTMILKLLLNCHRLNLSTSLGLLLPVVVLRKLQVYPLRRTGSILFYPCVLCLCLSVRNKFVSKIYQ